MADKRNDGNESSGSFSKSAVEKASSNEKNTPKNILQFETLISGFSASLIKTPEENLENELKSWLERFVKFLKVDRCIINEFMEKQANIVVTRFK